MLDNSDPLSHLTNQVYWVDTTVPAMYKNSTINECQSSRQEVVEDERVVEYMAPSSMLARIGVSHTPEGRSSLPGVTSRAKGP